jgi:hypothetical protein
MRGSAMKRWGYALAAVVVMMLTVGCTTANLGVTTPYVPEMPAKDLTTGWTQVGTLSYGGLVTSPSGRYVAFTTHEVHPPDTDPDPSSTKVYVLDLDTNSYSRVPAGDLLYAVRDDGELLSRVVHFTNNAPAVFLGVTTLGGGLVEIDVPDAEGDCAWSYASGGGFDVACSGKADINRYAGLYHWNVGDPNVTGVAVSTELSGYFGSISANGRYLEIEGVRDNGGLISDKFVEVWDLSTNTLLPHQFVTTYPVPPLVPSGTRRDAYIPVGDDGRLLVTTEVWSSVLETMNTHWWDPHDASDTPLAGFPPMAVAYHHRDGYFDYCDYTSLIGHSPAIENALGHQFLCSPILGNFNDPTARWRLPTAFSGAGINGFGADGTLVVVLPASGGNGIYVHRGPLP